MVCYFGATENNTSVQQIWLQQLDGLMALKGLKWLQFVACGFLWC